MATLLKAETTQNVPKALVLLAELSALAVFAFVIAKAFWFLLYGAYSEPFSFAEPDYQTRVRDTRLQPTADTFASLFSGGEASPPPDALEALPETRLSLRLFGVRTGQTPETGTAIVEAGAEGQRTYAVGHAITADAELAEVHADRIVISRGGIREVLFLREEGARQTSTSPAAVNVESLIADLSLRPEIEGGRLTGFRVEADNDEPAAQQLGLLRNDIIVAINGRPIPQNAEAAQRLLPQLGQSVQLTVRRNGERVTLDVSQ